MISSDEINMILTQLESVYGAGLGSDEYNSAPSEDCIRAAISDLEYYREDYHFLNLHVKADAFMKDLAWVSANSYFSGDSVVIFDNFPNSPDIGLLLLSFTKLTYSDSVTDELYKKLMAHLLYIDQEHVEFRYSNAYRCIKLVVMMIIYRSSVHAAIMCRFIIHQMAVSIGIR